MGELLARLRVPLLFVLLGFVSLVAMASDRSPRRFEEREPSWWRGAWLEVAAPVQRALAFPVDLLSDGWSEYVALLELREENERLRGRIVELEEENLQFREALVASERLGSVAEMRGELATAMRPAEVVGQDISPWFRSLLVNRGRSHGVRSGMPVVTERGVVGLVTATAHHAARTMLLLDRQSAIDGIVQRSRARGIVHGLGTERLEFVFVVRGDDVEVGDVVITSGLGGAYPKALRIGEVIDVSTEEDRLIHTATLRPTVDFGRLEQVFVMLWRGPTLELLYQGEEDGTQATAPEPQPAQRPAR
jgi:rod shape-determining protein MreC